MKKSFPILAFILCIICISCESDTEVSVEQEKFNHPLFSLEDINESNTRGPSCVGEYDHFERQLHWFSFISAQVIYTDAAARQEISSYFLTSSSNTIEAADLIGSNALPNFDAFNQAFTDKLLVYSNPGYPHHDGGEPAIPPVIGGMPIGNSAEAMAYAFYDSLLNDNCVELYFLDDIDFSNNFTVTSSSHPLYSFQCNEGYLWSLNITGGNDSTAIILDNTYRNNHDNILITRPYRDIRSECQYQEYNVNDFEDFMD